LWSWITCESGAYTVLRAAIDLRYDAGLVTGALTIPETNGSTLRVVSRGGDHGALSEP